jgi:hypothetical protein
MLVEAESDEAINISVVILDLNARTMTTTLVTCTSPRCAHVRLFATWGLPQLTGLFCRLDEAWIRAIDPATHGVTFSRPTTIGWGGRRCEFLFERPRPK